MRIEIAAVRPLLGLAALVLLSCRSPDLANAQRTLVGGPCEGCEAVFEFGDRELVPVDTLPGFEDADDKLKVTGTIFQPDGRTPAEGVILYIYHTNEVGVYETRGDETGWGRRHGFIRGWIETGADGRYTFYTRAPGSYASNPAHIHPLILEPDGRYYYISEYLFRGAPNLQNEESDGRGGPGVVALTEEDGVLVAKRDIVLGLGVPGY